MKYFLILCAFCIALSSQAQYYYKDIIGTKETNDLLKTYSTQHITQATISSNDPSQAESFIIRQKIDAPNGVMYTTSYMGDSITYHLTTLFDKDGRVTQTKDSAGTIVNTTTYTYNDQQLLQSITSKATDISKSINETEKHEWLYTADGKPLLMKRSINNGPATEVKMILDNQGNVSEEQSTKNGMNNFFYYYYNEKNQLTDVVHYNYKLRKLLPDYMFEYGEDGKVIQKIAVPVNSNQYQIWRFQFNEKGLKTKEAIFDKNKQLLGKIDYSYTAGQ